MGGQYVDVLLLLDFGTAKIGDLAVPVLDEDILWFQIVMDERVLLLLVGRVAVVEPLSDLLQPQQNQRFA